jgi:hypothetical protein
MLRLEATVYGRRRQCLEGSEDELARLVDLVERRVSAFTACEGSSAAATVWLGDVHRWPLVQWYVFTEQCEAADELDYAVLAHELGERLLMASDIHAALAVYKRILNVALLDGLAMVRLRASTLHYHYALVQVKLALCLLSHWRAGPAASCAQRLLCLATRVDEHNAHLCALNTALHGILECSAVDVEDILKVLPRSPLHIGCDD